MNLALPDTISFVGAGWAARTLYAPALAQLGARVAAVHDPDPGRAAALCAQLASGRVASSLDDLLAEPAALVVVATPNDRHVELAGRALESGHRVLCEKPLALDPTDASQLLRRGANRLTVSAPNRWRSDVLALRERVASGELGEIVRVRGAWLRSRGVPRPGSWYTDRSRAGGGVLADLGPHLLDALMFVAGRPVVPTRCMAWTSRSRPRSLSWMPRTAEDTGPDDVEHRMVACAESADGLWAELDLAWHQARAEDETTLEIEGTRGRATLRTLFGFAPRPARAPFELRTWSDERSSVREFDDTREPGADFARVIAHALDPHTSALDGEIALAIAHWARGCYASLRAAGGPT